MVEAAIELIENLSDPLWRLNNLYWCIDIHGKKVPFRLNDAQQRLIRDLWYRNIILKARQLGFTTLIGILGLDGCLFNDHYSAGICAHTRDDVEKIFERKVKFPYEELPDGLRTARPADTDSAKKLKFNNGSSIEVATSLRSGTYQFAHVSEFGKICAKYPEKAREIVTGTFETVHPGSLLFVESTAEGREGYFAQYCFEALKRKQESINPNKLQFKLHFFPWFEDPKNKLDGPHTVITDDQIKYFKELESELGIKLDDKQRAWYVTKDETLQEDMKREHPSTPEEAFEAAISGAYLAKQMATVRKNNQICVVPYDPTMPVNTGWDFGLGDTMCIWMHQMVGLQHRLIDFIYGTDEDLLYYWRELQSKKYVFGTHYLPHDADSRRIGTAASADDKPKTVKQILHDAGMSNIKVVPKIDDKWTAIQEARLFLPMCYIEKQKCDYGIKGLDNFRREWDDKTGDWKNRPHHDWATHPYDAFETLARGIRKFGCNTASVKFVPKRPQRARKA